MAINYTPYLKGCRLVTVYLCDTDNTKAIVSIDGKMIVGKPFHLENRDDLIGLVKSHLKGDSIPAKLTGNYRWTGKMFKIKDGELK